MAKILLNMEGVGVLACDKYNFIVADGIRDVERKMLADETDDENEPEDVVEKKIDQVYQNPRFYSEFEYALRELYRMFLKNKLSKGKPALSMEEFLNRVEKTGQEWFDLAGILSIPKLKKEGENG